MIRCVASGRFARETHTPMTRRPQRETPRRLPRTGLLLLALLCLASWVASPASAQPPIEDPMSPIAGESAIEGEPATAPVEPTPSADQPLEITSARQLLEVYGADDSYWELFWDDQPVDEGELEGLHQIMYALGRFSAANLQQWAKPASALPKLMADLDPHRGEIVTVVGRCTEFERMTVSPETRRRLNFDHYFRCRVVIEDPAYAPLREAIVYTRAIPEHWQTQGQPAEAEWQVSAVGTLVKSGAEGAPVIVSQRIAWHAWGLLGKTLGVDIGLLEKVRPRSQKIDGDGFYALLDGVGRYRPGLLFGYAGAEIGAVEFGEQSIRDWPVFPWQLRTSEARLGVSPGSQIMKLLDDETKAAIERVPAGEMPDDATIAQILRGLNNSVLNSPELYSTEAFKGVFLDLEQIDSIQSGVALLGNEAVQRFNKALVEARKVSSTDPSIRQGLPPSEELTRFIQLGLSRLSQSELRKFNRTLLSESFHNMIVPNKATSVVPMFNAPASQTGRLVMLHGLARKAVQIIITDEAVRERLGIDHYYEVWIYTDDSQNNPLVVCCRELPKKMELGDEISVSVRVPAIFLQMWMYQSVVSYDEYETQRQAAREAVEAGMPDPVVGKQTLPNAPLLVAPTLEILPPPQFSGAPIYGWLAATLFVLAGLSLCVLGWHFHRDDARFQRHSMRPRYAPEGTSLNELGIEAEPEPDFRFLDGHEEPKD